MIAYAARPERAGRFAPGRLCVCGNAFTPNHGHQRYCSPKCRPKWEGYSHKCKVCGQPFRSLKTYAKYCSNECKHIGFTTSHASDCLVCGTMFDRGKNPRRKCCSPECRYRLQVLRSKTGGMRNRSFVDIAERAPHAPQGLVHFLTNAPYEAVDRSWVGLLTAEFCAGRRNLLSECLRTVRTRVRDEMLEATRDRYRACGTPHESAV